MKKIIKIGLMLSLAAAMAVTVSAKQSYEAPKGTPNIDGYKDEIYNASTEVAIDFERHEGSVHASGLAYTAWDNNNLYVFVEVTDPVLSTEKGEGFWETDSVEVYLDCLNREGNEITDVDAGQFTAGLLYKDENGFITKGNIGGQGQHHWIVAEQGKVCVVKTEQGYNCEYSIPWGDEFIPANGEAVGFTVAINDDADGKVGREFQVFTEDGLYEAWHSTNNYGTLTLVEDVDATVTINDVNAVGRAGETVEMDILVKGKGMFNQLALYDFSYNDSVLIFDGFSKFDTIRNTEHYISDFEKIDEENKALIFGWDEKQAFDNIYVCSVKFRIAEDAAPGYYRVNLKELIKNDLTKLNTAVNTGLVEVIKMPEPVPVPDSIDFKLSNAEGNRGDTVTVEISVESTDANSIALENLEYDKNALKFIGFTDYEEISSKCFIAEFDNEKGAIALALNEAVEGYICKANFLILENAAADNYNVSMNAVVKKDAEVLSSKVESGVIKVNVEQDHKHTLVHKDAVAATCCNEGSVEYWLCEGCGKKFTDAEGTTIIDNVIVPKNPDNHVGETEIRNAVEPTATKDGYSGDKYCLSCGEIIEKGKVIPATGEDIENKLKVSISNVTARAGNTVDVVVSIDNNPGIAGMKLVINNSSELRLVNVNRGDAVSNLNSTILDNKILFDGIENDMSTGVLLTLTYEIPEEIEIGTYPIEIAFSDVYKVLADNDIQDIDVTVCDGSIEIVEFVYGDVNNDGVVSGKDVTLLRRYLVEIITGDALNLSAADVNLDGYVNGKDVTLIRRFLVGYDITLGK